MSQSTITSQISQALDIHTNFSSQITLDLISRVNHFTNSKNFLLCQRVNIPKEKRLCIALQYIYGIGATKALDICSKTNIDTDRRVYTLTEQEILAVREMIDSGYQVEGDLRREVGMNIKRLRDLGCYRGLRHRKNLPVRGQRTHSNARTRKGRAKPIAGKKGV